MAFIRHNRHRFDDPKPGLMPMNTTKLLANALLLIALLFVVQGVNAGTATVPIEPGFSIVEVHGDQEVSMSFWHGIPIATFNGTGHVLALASNGSVNYTVTAFIGQERVPAPVIPSYAANFSRLDALVLGVGDILQSQEYPEPYNDSQLRGFIAVEVLKALDAIKAAEATTTAQQDDLDAIKAAQDGANWPPWLSLAAVLSLAGFLAWKEHRHGPRSRTGPETTSAGVQDAPLVLAGDEEG